MKNYDDLSDWDALRQFRSLGTDQERMEQMFMAHLSAARMAHAVATDIKEVKELQRAANGRVGKLETHWIQGAAVIAFLLVAMPLALAAAAIYLK